MPKFVTVQPAVMLTEYWLPVCRHCQKRRVGLSHIILENTESDSSFLLIVGTSGTARAALWYSPVRKEAMAEIKLF